MSLNLRTLKKAYELLKNDRIRATLLKSMEFLNLRKDVVRLDTNDVCNIQCIMCKNKPQKCTPQHYTPLGDFKKYIDNFHSRIRLLYLSCGYEPLMTPDFSSYMSYASSKKIPFISFATNGVLLKKEIARQMVDQRINEIIVSFNGPDRENYNRIMFRSNYDRLIENLTVLKKYKKEKNSPYPEIRLNMILMKSNLINFDKIAEFIDTYDVKTVQFRQLRVGQGINDMDEIKKESPDNLKPEEMQEIAQKLADYARKASQSGIQVIIPSHILETSSISPSAPPQKKKSCSVPFFSNWIEFDGTLKVCLYDPQGVVGNIYKDSYEEIQKKIENYRKKAISGACTGNCKTMNLETSLVI